MKSADIVRRQPQYLAEEYASDGIDNEIESGQFTCLMVCSVARCGQVVAVSGPYQTRFFTNHDEETGSEISWDDTNYYIRSMFPAPPMFVPPKGLGDECRKHLKSAFGLFWNDPAACANRMRVFVEYFLNQLGVPRKGKKKTKTGYDGKMGNYDLFDRIAVMQDTHPGFHTSFEALRTVGNLGSHEAEADFDNVLTCFQLLEHALIELLDKRTEKLMAKAQDIIDKKGRKKPLTP